MIDPDLDHDEKTEPGASFPSSPAHRKPYEAPAVREATPEEAARAFPPVLTLERCEDLAAYSTRPSSAYSEECAPTLAELAELVRVYRAAVEYFNTEPNAMPQPEAWRVLASVRKSFIYNGRVL